MPDKRKLPGKLIGADPLTDVALVKVEGSNFPVVALGTSQSLQPGEWVVAIGSPFGFENSVDGSKRGFSFAAKF